MESKVNDSVKQDIDVKLIDENPDNEYLFGYDDLEFLAEEVKDDGFSGIVEVYAKKDGRYEINSGHKRFRAAKLNGIKKVPCLVTEYPDEVTKAKKLIMSNIHNRNISPLRMARCLDYYDRKVLKDSGNYEGSRRNELAKRFNMTSSAVGRYLQLLSLIPQFQEYVNRPGASYVKFVQLSSLPEYKQVELYKIMTHLSADGDISTLTAEDMKNIISKYDEDFHCENARRLQRQQESVVDNEFFEQIIKHPSDEINELQDNDHNIEHAFIPFDNDNELNFANENGFSSDIVDNRDYFTPMPINKPVVRQIRDDGRYDITESVIQLTEGLNTIVSRPHTISDERKKTECVDILRKILHILESE